MTEEEVPAAAATVTASATSISKTSETKSEGNNMPLTAQQRAKYEPLRGLLDLKTTRDLTEDGVRDILRRFTHDHSLEVVSLGALEDMSGLNDAFNSSICSMKVRVRRNEEDEEDYNFV